MKILIVGNGSIGTKHYNNLRIMGEDNIKVCDPKGGDYKDIYEVKDMFDLVIISSPALFHVEHFHYFNDRKYPYLMVEKPLYLPPSGPELAMQAKLPIVMKPLHSDIFVDYPYRFERGINKLKELMPMVGNMTHATLENSYWYDKLHPNIPYENYEGIIWDDIHLINISRFLFGEPDKILAKYVDKDLAIFDWVANGIPISHMSDILNTRYKKRIEIRGTEGTLVWNWKAHEIFFAPADESERRAIPYKHACHLTESLKYVLDVVREGKNFEQNTLFDAIADMEVAKKLCKK